MAQNIAYMFILCTIYQHVIGQQDSLLPSLEIAPTQELDFTEIVQPSLNTNLRTGIQPTSTYTSASYSTERVIATGSDLQSSISVSLSEETQWSANDVNTRISVSETVSDSKEQQLSPSVTTYTSTGMQSLKEITSSVQGTTIQPSLLANPAEGTTMLSSSMNSIPSQDAGSILIHGSEVSQSVFSISDQSVIGITPSIKDEYSTLMTPVYSSLLADSSSLPLAPSSSQQPDAFSVGITPTVMMENDSLASVIKPTSVSETQLLEGVTSVDISSVVFATNISILASSVVTPSVASLITGLAPSMDVMSSLGINAWNSESTLNYTQTLETSVSDNSSLTLPPIMDESVVVVEMTEMPGVQVTLMESISELNPSFVFRSTMSSTVLPSSATEQLPKFDSAYVTTTSSEVPTVIDMLTVTSIEFQASSLAYSAISINDDFVNVTNPNMTDTVTMATNVTYTDERANTWCNVKAKLILSGNCSILDQLNAVDQLRDFRFKMKEALSQEMELNKEQIRIMDTKCGSVIVKVLFLNVTSATHIFDLLKNMTGINLFNSSAGNMTFGFRLLHSELLPEEKSVVPKFVQPGSKKLTDVQVIIIIICSVVGGTLLMYAFGFCIYACYQKKKTQSFDLSEMPISDLNMDDFTLTKMDRPHLMYSDYGPVLQPARVSGKATRKADRYQPFSDEMQCLAVENVHSVGTLPCRSVGDTVYHTELSCNKTQDQETAAFVNPSFSCDDALHSNPPTLWQSSFNADSQQNMESKDHIVTTDKNTNGHLVGEGATSF